MSAEQRQLRFQPRPWSNDPPYLFHIANHCTDVPSALAWLRELAEEAAERSAEMWAAARAMGAA
jgi:hypothetical protein